MIFWAGHDPTENPDFFRKPLILLSLQWWSRIWGEKGGRRIVKVALYSKTCILASFSSTLAKTWSWRLSYLIGDSRRPCKAREEPGDDVDLYNDDNIMAMSKGGFDEKRKNDKYDLC